MRIVQIYPSSMSKLESDCELRSAQAEATENNKVAIDTLAVVGLTCCELLSVPCSYP
jgi:hypothetical protein